VEGEQIANVAAAGRRLLAAAPGGPAVRVTVQRGGQEVSLSIAPGRRPRRVLLAPSDEMEEALQANLVEVVDGPTSQQGLRIANLVRGGRGEKWGYFDGDVIVMVQGKGVRRRETFDKIVRDENSHIFGESGSEAGPSRLSTYQIRLAIRDAKKEEKVDSTYTNLFPDILSAPVY
jgi:S1-C subfamily serine protease